MNYSVRFERDAVDQLAVIEDHIASRVGCEIAANFVGNVLHVCNTLSMFPHRGRGRDDIRAGLRITGYHRRVAIAFTVDDEKLLITIVGVFYGGQDWESRLSS